MSFVATMSNTDVAAIAAFSSMMTAIIASAVSWWNGHHQNEIDENTTLFDAYHNVVENLQQEIGRLQSELSLIRDEMKRCESSNQKLSNEVKKLQNCVTKLTVETERIESALTVEIPEDDA
jgi:predicted nuclease with TOPRIM domain